MNKTTKSFEINYSIIAGGNEYPRTMTINNRTKNAAMNHLKQRLKETLTNNYEITGVKEV